MGTRMVIWWQVVSKMFAPKIIRIWQFFFKLQSIMLGMLFDIFLFISTHISLVLFSPGSLVKKMEYWMVIWWPVVPEIFVLKITKIRYPFFKWQSIMFGMFFCGHINYVTLCQAMLVLNLDGSPIVAMHSWYSTNHLGQLSLANLLHAGVKYQIRML